MLGDDTIIGDTPYGLLYKCLTLQNAEVQEGCYDLEITIEKQKRLLLTTTSWALIGHFNNIDTTPISALNVNHIETSNQGHGGLCFR